MALAINTLARNAVVDGITAQIDAAADGLLEIYDGARPASGGAATTLLAHLVMSTVSFPAASGGTATANAIADDVSADATGTATWFRITDSASTWVIDGDVGVSGSDLNLNTVSITSGVNVAVTSFVITAGNA